MPVDQPVLGFSNRWYRWAVDRAVHFALLDDINIWIPTAPVFLATKWEAFLRRGEWDYLGSHDLEDIITVVAGRPEVARALEAEPPEVARALEAEPPEVRGWLSRTVRHFLAEAQSVYALQGALPDMAATPELLTEIQNRFERIAEIR